MKYSIVIPVFNKASFTRHCLDTLQATLAGAGEGEVIVVDNASSDGTPELLKQYPWIKLIRNETNLGFAAANNQGARAAQGDYLVLLNNDTEGFPGWLEAMLQVAEEPGVGIVGAKLLFADDTVQHGGVAFAGVPYGPQRLGPFHFNYLIRSDDVDASKRRDVQAVTGACLVTPRALYLELGGLDEAYWNGYEDVDYCLKVHERGMRIVYEPAAVLYHFESQSGVQRFRRNQWNAKVLEARWRDKIRFDAGERMFERGSTRRTERQSRGDRIVSVVKTPAVTVVVHGEEPPGGRESFERALRTNFVPVDRVVWATSGDSTACARDAMEVRGNRYLVTVRGAAMLEPHWLDALASQVEGLTNVCAATAAPEAGFGPQARPLAADARCTLINLRRFPQHVRLDDRFETLDGAIADLLLRGVDLRLGTRGVDRSVATLPPIATDRAFEAVHGFPLRDVFRTGEGAIEARWRSIPKRARGLVSIVTLSWNAPTFTKIALDSIRAQTPEPYEVIVVDNGSKPETLEFLRSIDDPHVRVIYNEKNLGFGRGNNIGLAHARGEYVVILNNDVVVTEGWLDGLLAPFDRIPWLGVTAPRSNVIAGDQVVTDALYNDEPGLVRYANERRRRWKQQGYVTERVIGFCMCVDRRVIDEVGGFDPIYGLGNFEDDDLCIRIRAAGYGIYVCDDVFIHHFGSQSFKANNVDYAASMAENWRRFATKWNFDLAYDPNKGYDPRGASYNGFRRDAHYVPLPAVQVAIEPAHATSEPPGVVFVAHVEDEEAWQRISGFVRRFARAFAADERAELAIGVAGELGASTVGVRVARLLERAGLDEDAVGTIDIRDVDDRSWLSAIEAGRVVPVDEVRDASPVGLRRYLEETATR